MKIFFISALLAFVTVGCSHLKGNEGNLRTPANMNTSGLYVKGKKALGLIDLFEKAHALNPEGQSCGMGSCDFNGSMNVSCRYPNNPNENRGHFCKLSSMQSESNHTVLESIQAKHFLTLLDTATTNEEVDDLCGMGSCEKMGAFRINCRYPIDSQTDMNCEIAFTKSQ